MKTYQVQLTDGTKRTVTAEIVTYDNADNLLFYNNVKIQPLKNDEGSKIELVLCINKNAFISYGQAPTEH